MIESEKLLESSSSKGLLFKDRHASKRVCIYLLYSVICDTAPKTCNVWLNFAEGNCKYPAIIPGDFLYKIQEAQVIFFKL